MATKKKLDFDFSKFGCQADEVQELVEAMGFKVEEDKSVFVSPLDQVKRTHQNEVLLVVTRGLQRLAFPDDKSSWEDFIPILESSSSGVPSVNGVYKRYLTTLDGKRIRGFKD